MAGPGHTHTARPTAAKPPGQAPQAAPGGEVIRFPARATLAVREQRRCLRHAVLVQVLPFGGGRQLSISIDEPNAIMGGAGMHRLTCRVALDARNTIAGGVPVALSGWAWLGHDRHGLARQLVH